MKKLVLIFAGLLLGLNAWAVDVEGVDLPEKLHIGDHDLVLNGAGVRNRFVFFDMYVAALYLTAKTNSSEAILSSNGEKRLALHMVQDVSSETLSKSFYRAIAHNLTRAELTALEPQLKQLDVLFAMMSEATEGDVITMDYVPGKGTEIAFNDVTIGVIEGAAFNSALLKVWLGINPVQENLKKKLLGGQ